MPGKPNNIIGNLRQRYEPHKKLESKVDFNHHLIHGIEGKLRDLPNIHKTLSKSFGMQRKTLLRVIEIEKQVDAITIIVENIQDGLEDAIDKKKRRRRPRRSAKKPPKTPHTPKDWDEEVPGDWDKTTGRTPEGVGEPDEAILDGEPDEDILDGESDEAILDGEPDEAILDGEPSPAIIGEPEPGINPDTDLQPIDDSEEVPEDGTDTQPTQPNEPEDGRDTRPTQPNEPEEQGGKEPKPEDEPEQEIISEPDLSEAPPSASEDQEVVNKFIFKELTNIHSSISILTGHTKNVLQRVLNLDERISTSEKKITLIKNILEAQKSDIGDNLVDLEPDEDKVKSPLSESIQNIADSTTSIQETLIRQQDLDRSKEDDTDIDDEQDKRDDKEKKGEGIGAGIKKVGMKMLAPVQSAFDRIKEWLIKLFAAKAVMMFMNWFSDPENAKKVSSLFRFIKDWWPAIVTGLILFAGSMLGPTGIIIGITALVVGFVPKIINAVKSIFGFGKDASKEAEKGEKLANKSDKLADKQEKGTGGDDIKPDDVSEAPEPGSTSLQPPAQEFNKGGEVPGKGDKDTVPAMLTPGEFVMSKGAVEEYGVNTLEGMNAAAGGTNKPEDVTIDAKAFKGGGPVMPQTPLVRGYSGGGEIKPPETKAEEPSEEKKKKEAPKLNRETGRLATRIEPLVTGQPPGMGGLGGALMAVAEKHPAVMLAKGIGSLIGKGMGKVGDMMKKEEPDLDLKEAIADLQNRFNYSIYDGNYKPGGGVAAGDGGGGADSAGGGGGGSNPLAGFIAGVSKLPIIGGPMAMVGGLLVNGIETMIDEKLKLSDTQKGTATPDAPTPPTTTVAYQEAQKAARGGGAAATSSANPGGKIPNFSASAKVNPRKVKVLGISR